MNARVYRGVLCSVCSLLLACAGPGVWKTEFDVTALPGAGDYPDEGAVILLDECAIEIFSSGRIAYSSLHRHRLTRILNERGFAHAIFTIPYTSATQVRNIRARTVTPGGEIHILSQDQIFDINVFPGYIFYSDIRAKRFTFPAVSRNCVLEVEYEKETRQFTTWDQWTFQSDVPTELSRYRVRAPAELEIKWKTVGIDLEPVSEPVPAGFKRDWLWEARDLPPLVPEAGMPPARRVAAALLFSPFGLEDWPAVGRWYHELIRDRVRPTEAVRRMAEHLSAAGRDPREVLNRLYCFVRDEIRYIAISIGIGGYQPHAAGEVLRHRYGDCKDKIALLAALAGAEGLSIEPVLISTWQNGDVDTTLAAPFHFNHVIARALLPDSTVLWLDPTEEQCPFADLPWYDRGRLVFCIGLDGKGRWERTPGGRAAENVLHRSWELNADSSGLGRGRLSLLATGAFAIELRDQLVRLRREQIETWIAAEILRLFPQSSLQRYTLPDLKSKTHPLRLKADFEAPLRPDNAHFSILAPHALSAFDWPSLLAQTRRKHLLRLPYPHRRIDELALKVANPWSIAVAATGDTVISPFGRFRLRVEQRPGGGLGIRREFQIDRTEIPVRDYPDFREFINDIALLDRTALWLGD